MFSSFDSTQTPAVKVWNNTNTVQTNSQFISLEDDCAPFQYFMLGASANPITVKLPNVAVPGKQITFKVDLSGANTNSQTLNIIHTNNQTINVIGAGQSVTFIYVPQSTGNTINGGVQASCWVQVTGGSSTTTSNQYAFIAGGYSNNATGYGAVVSGGTGNNSTSQACTVSGGNSNNATAMAATIGGGLSNAANGQYSTVSGGYSNIASGTYSTIVGGAYGSARSIIGLCVIPANQNPVEIKIGATQTTILNLGTITTTATPKGLCTDSGSPASTNQLILVNNAASTFQGQVTAIAQFVLATTAASGSGTTATLTFATQTAAPFIVGQTIAVAGITPTGYNTAAGVVTACTTTTVSYTNVTTGAQTVAGTVTGTSYTSAWTFTGAIQRSSSAAGTRIVGIPSINLVAQDVAASGWVLALTADTTYGGLTVTGTGATGVTIRWMCTLLTNEVTY